LFNFNQSIVSCLQQEELMTLPLFGSKKADNMLAAIETSRKMDLATLLCGLGIE